jgi:hypothetical protein
MKVRQGPARAALLPTLVGALVASAVGLSAAPASAATTPPYEPDAGAAGTITFYDASGAVVTSGSTSALIGYAVGSASLTATNAKAALYGYLPKSGQAPGAWSGELLAGPTTYPVAGAPAAVAGSSNPAVKPVTGDLTFGDLAKDFPNTATDAYAQLYQIRIKTSDEKYLATDISVSGSTWTEVYPTAGTGGGTAPSITASPGTILAGKLSTVTVTGTPGAAYTVLAANRPSSTFVAAHRGTFSSTGTSSFTVHPLNNVNLVVQVGSVTSSQVIVAVHTGLNIAVKKAGHVLTFYGQVYPNRVGQKIYIYTGTTRVGQAVRDSTGKNWTFRHDFSSQAGKALVFYSYTASDTQNSNGHSQNLRAVL